MRAISATVFLFGVSVSGFQCPDRIGLYPDKTNCSRFIKCSDWTPYSYDCPQGLHFAAKSLICDWPHIASCDGTVQVRASTNTPRELSTHTGATGDESTASSAAEDIPSLTETASFTEETESTSRGDQTPEDRCPPLNRTGSSSDTLRWRRWQYGEIMPRDVLKVGERLFESTTGRITGQFSAVVRVFYDGKSKYGTTMGPSKFANSGIYFVHNGQLIERNYEFVQILCVDPRTEASLYWVQTSSGACAVENVLITDDEFMIGRATHDLENGVIVAAGTRQGEPLTTAFKNVRTHNIYEVLAERRPDF